jgi:hypothetical protein
MFTDMAGYSALVLAAGLTAVSNAVTSANRLSKTMRRAAATPPTK